MFLLLSQTLLPHIPQITPTFIFFHNNPLKLPPGSMDFGVLDGLISSETNTNNNSLYPAFDLDPKLPKQEKSPLTVSGSATSHNQQWKMPEISQFDFSNRMPLKQQQRSDRSSQNMLSFSSPNTQQNLMFPYSARTDSGYGYGRLVAGVRGPFSPSQWVELEHQALIFKYITFNAPIPSNLLIPIRKALESATFCSYPNLRHSSYNGWGGFHLGFSNRSDPEPGRCRRTDGKKWRCSRDAVADQKYCERHMNRGRHRSRKPVEGQSQTANTATAVMGKVSLPATANTASNVITPLNPHQLKVNMSSEKTQDSTSQSLLTPLPSPKHKAIPDHSDFGFVLSDSLLNPLQENNNGSQKSQNYVHQFMDDWQHTERTQLSISSNSSPIRERINIFGERSQLNLIPLSVEASMGGPLGEVLNHSTNSSR